MTMPYDFKCSIALLSDTLCIPRTIFIDLYVYIAHASLLKIVDAILWQLNLEMTIKSPNMPNIVLRC